MWVRVRLITLKNTLEKRNLVIIIILAAIVVIGAIFFFAMPPKLSDEDILNNPSAAMDACRKVSGQNQENCYLKIAELLRLNNALLAFQACSEIKSESRNGCVDNLIQSQNTIDAKLEILKNMDDENWKKQYIEEIVPEETDPQKALEICNEIKRDTNFREHCYGLIQTGPGNADLDIKLSMCDSGASMNNKDNCYRNIAEGLWETNPLKSVEICQKISDSNMKSGCLNNFLGSPELIKANPAIAEEICSSSPLTMKSRCYNDYARALSGSDPKKAAEVCKKLSDDVQISDCYGNVWFSFDAIILQNYDFAIGLCDILTLKRDDCLRRTASSFMNSDKTKADAICNLMSTSTSSGCGLMPQQ